MGNRKPRPRRVRRTKRYLSGYLGPVHIKIRVRPGWQAGAATAAGFAKNLNAAGELLRQIRAGRYPHRAWLPHATWYSAWRAAEAILRPSLRNGGLARSPWFLAPESAHRFERVSRAHPVTFTTWERGIPNVAGEDARADVVLMLYEFFESRARDRLKVCAGCDRWFADETKNRAQRWCSDECHTRGWGRAARRAAGHAQYTHAKKGTRR